MSMPNVPLDYALAFKTLQSVGATTEECEALWNMAERCQALEATNKALLVALEEMVHCDEQGAARPIKKARAAIKQAKGE